MEVSVKSTKNEILEAYETLLKQVQEEKANVPKKVQEEKQKTEVLTKVSETSHDGIVKNISNLKIALNTSLDQLGSNLAVEFKKLEEIRSAISVEKKNLEDLYSLSANTDSLAAMLLVQKEKREGFDRKMQEEEFAFSQKMKLEKETFESEIKNIRELWKAEKQRQDLEEKEYLGELKKQRKREEDEYSYGLKISRQKEEDAYLSEKLRLEKELSDKKQLFEQEMAKREDLVKSAENELNELRKLSAEFPNKLSGALVSKEKEIVSALTTRFDFERKLYEKQTEGDLKLKEQTIKSLQEKIAEMQIQIRELNEKATKAEMNVKDIAVKAIESSSKVQFFQKKEGEGI